MESWELFARAPPNLSLPSTVPSTQQKGFLKA
jgi:hypothetical protein